MNPRVFCLILQLPVEMLMLALILTTEAGGYLQVMGVFQCSTFYLKTTLQKRLVAEPGLSKQRAGLVRNIPRLSELRSAITNRVPLAAVGIERCRVTNYKRHVRKQ